MQRATRQVTGSPLRTARLLRELPLVTAAALDRRLTPAQAAVLTRLVGTTDPAWPVEAQPHLITVAAGLDPHPLGVRVAHQLATHCNPEFEAEPATGAGRARSHLHRPWLHPTTSTVRRPPPAPPRRRRPTTLDSLVLLRRRRLQRHAGRLRPHQLTVPRHHDHQPQPLDDLCDRAGP